VILALTSVVLLPNSASAAGKPSCVSVSTRETNPGGWYSKSVATLANGCRTTRHLRVIWHLGRDSSCLRVAPGRAVRTTAPLTISYYDRTVSC
jgi:hypothetical protein